MYFVRSNIFHIYKLMGLYSLKWSIATQNKDTGIINACFLKTEVQCTTESREMWIYWVILNSRIHESGKDSGGLECRRSSATCLVGDRDVLAAWSHRQHLQAKKRFAWSPLNHKYSFTKYSGRRTFEFVNE